MDQYDFDNIVTGTTFGTALDSTTEFLLYFDSDGHWD